MERSELNGESKERKWMDGRGCVLERKRGEERGYPLLSTPHQVDDPTLDSPGNKLNLPAKDPSR